MVKGATMQANPALELSLWRNASFVIGILAAFNGIGALISGWLGTVAGYQPTLLVGAVITLIGAFIQQESPIRHER